MVKEYNNVKLGMVQVIVFKEHFHRRTSRGGEHSFPVSEILNIFRAKCPVGQKYSGENILRVCQGQVCRLLSLTIVLKTELRSNEIMIIPLSFKSCVFSWKSTIVPI